MKIFVISLKASYDRHAVMVEQMERLGLPFEFVDAVDGRQLSGDELAELYDRKWAYRQEGRHLTRGEIGCSLSHLRVYRKIVEDDIPFALVLEDDAWLTPSIVGVLEAIKEKITPEMKAVFLMQEMGPGRLKNKGDSISIIDDLFVCREKDSAQWTHAYIVTNQASKSLTSALTPVTHTADSWGWLIRHKVVSVYGMNRTLSTQNMYDLKSIIGFERTAKNNWLFGNMTHKAYRAFWLTYDILVSLKRRIRSRV